MTFMTLKKISRSGGSKMVFEMLWCFCVLNLVRIHKIVLQILNGNNLLCVVNLNDLCTKFGDDKSNISSDIEQKPLSYAVALKDLENMIKVILFELGLCLALVLLCTTFGEDASNISSDIQRTPSFTWRRLECPL